jgi:peptide methionine sulfoxide reductase MsrA
MSFQGPLSQHHQDQAQVRCRFLPLVQVVHVFVGLGLAVLSLSDVVESFTGVGPSTSFGGTMMTRHFEAEVATGTRYCTHARTTGTATATRIFLAGGDDSSSAEPNSIISTSTQATEKALLGMGCFWAPQEQFTKVSGVLKATSGYAVAYYNENDNDDDDDDDVYDNNNNEEREERNPKISPSSVPAASYFSVCNGDGRTEAVLVEYDPSVTSYQKMLSYFWQGHNAAAQQLTPDKAVQYASVIWPLSEEQRRIAVEDLDKATSVYEQAKIGTPKTIISENVLRQGDYSTATSTTTTTTLFTPAETIHQNFWTKLSVKMGVILAVSALSSYNIVPESVAYYGLQAILLWVFWESVELAAAALGSLGLAKPTMEQKQQITSAISKSTSAQSSVTSSSPKL